MKLVNIVRFWAGGVPLNSVMNIHCSTAEGGADKNWMDVDMRSGTVEIFHK